MKSTLMIKDLSVNKELDCQTMSAVRGGFVKFISPEESAYLAALDQGKNMMAYHQWYMYGIGDGL